MFCQEWEYNKIILDEETNKHISQAVTVFLPEVLNLVNIKSVTGQPSTSLTLLYTSTTLDSKPGNKKHSLQYEPNFIAGEQTNILKHLFYCFNLPTTTLPSTRGEQYIIPCVYRFISSAVSQQ